MSILKNLTSENTFAILDMPAELPLSFLAGYGGALLFYGFLWLKRTGQLKGLPLFLGILFFSGLINSLVLLGLSIALKISFVVQFVLSLLFCALHDGLFKNTKEYKNFFSKKSEGESEKGQVSS